MFRIKLYALVMLALRILIKHEQLLYLFVYMCFVSDGGKFCSFFSCFKIDSLNAVLLSLSVFGIWFLLQSKQLHSLFLFV